MVSLATKAQTFSNDFENRQERNSPWINLHIVADSSAAKDNFVSICDTLHEYGMGFCFDADTIGDRHNIRCKYSFRFKASDDTRADIVVSIDDTSANRYWNAYPLRKFVDREAEWSLAHLDLCFPQDHTQKSEIKVFVWNKGWEHLAFDDAQLEILSDDLPSYQPTSRHEFTSEQRFHFKVLPFVEYINAEGDTLRDSSLVEANVFITPALQLDGEDAPLQNADYYIHTVTHFKESTRLLRLAFIMPLPKGEITVYRRNQQIDTVHLQSAYYLDREGFAVKSDSLCLCTYHSTGISSLQLDVENRTVCFNIDYWRDHPLLHYPLRTDTTDYFEDLSYRNVEAGETIEGDFCLHLGAVNELPRLMPVWDGYQSAFIFTEHADWTDLSTHRAVLFGHEGITQPKDAIGGFCHFGIPVTKSVFYWNPDNVTNAATSHGLFVGPVASIKADKTFYSLLKTLKKEGFEICLHTPEVYTTIPSELPKAMRYMRRHFGTVSWIDHGYNNGPDKNRENLVGDGLLQDSPFYAAGLWKENGVRYLWNPYYEEHRTERHNFSGHFVQPYDGYGDALPNRQITTLPNGDKDFLLWSTSSTLEIMEDHEWYYYFDNIRLQRLADQHNVFIAHIYPAWSDPNRAFWQYNEGGTAVAMPGFNFALSQLAHFREDKKILPTTIQEYLNYYEKLLKVDYQIVDSTTISLTNRGDKINGLTLLCTKPIVVEGKVMDFREVDEGYLVWFDLDKNETAIIRQER